MAINPLKMARKLTYKPGDRLFEPMNDLTIILASLAHAMSLMANNKAVIPDMNVMRIKPITFDFGIAIPLQGPLEIALRGDKPEHIDIGLIAMEDAIAPLVAPPGHQLKQTGGFKSVMEHVAQPIFLGFFERYNVWLTDNLGEAVNWPGTLNFARVVRNAIAHGRINFRDPRTPPVWWKGLTYSYADRGKAIIGTDLGSGDLIGLMIEADEELTKLGAPIL